MSSPTPPNTTCPDCGQPAGECYNLCPNSPAYYSAEQERADDPFYGQDSRDGYGDPDYQDTDDYYFDL